MLLEAVTFKVEKSFIDGVAKVWVQVGDRYTVVAEGDSYFQALSRLYPKMMYSMNSFRLQMFEGDNLVQELIYQEVK